RNDDSQYTKGAFFIQSSNYFITGIASIVKESNRLRVKMPLCKRYEAPEIYRGFSLVEIGDNFWIPPRE
ncbi:hypothetical protein, partial [Paenibacillus sp. PAMC 26794]|uniref:hypothetical protein n=1 Tax=Paenibacillus sp. PAMC 26794 TaxID=1257080 RepID=UPI00047518B3